MVGVLDVVGSTNIAMKKGFEANGYYVEEYNYRTKITEHGGAGMHADFESFIQDRKFDLTVFCKVNQMNPSMITHAGACGPTWYWFMDPAATARAMQASMYAQRADFCSATCSDVQWRFSMVNYKAYQMIEGYDPDVYYFEDLRKIRQCVFIGNATIPRIQIINDLKKAGVEVTIFGHGWPVGMKTCPPVFNEDERTEICQSKVVLNLVQDGNIFSDRIVKALACGAEVASMHCDDLTTKFPTFVHLADSPEQLSNVIKHLSSKPQSSIMLHERVGLIERDYTWKAVCNTIMEKVGENADTVRKS